VEPRRPSAVFSCLARGRDRQPWQRRRQQRTNQSHHGRRVKTRDELQEHPQRFWAFRMATSISRPKFIWALSMFVLSGAGAAPPGRRIGKNQTCLVWGSKFPFRLSAACCKKKAPTCLPTLIRQPHPASFFPSASARLHRFAASAAISRPSHHSPEFLSSPLITFHPHSILTSSPPHLPFLVSSHGPCLYRCCRPPPKSAQPPLNRRAIRLISLTVTWPKILPPCSNQKLTSNQIRLRSSAFACPLSIRRLTFVSSRPRLRANVLDTRPSTAKGVRQKVALRHRRGEEKDGWRSSSADSEARILSHHPRLDPSALLLQT
jgi:hypothetical protein